jgi:hypothetical protein
VEYFVEKKVINSELILFTESVNGAVHRLYTNGVVTRDFDETYFIRIGENGRIEFRWKNQTTWNDYVSACHNKQFAIRLSDAYINYIVEQGLTLGDDDVQNTKT